MHTVFQRGATPLVRHHEHQEEAVVPAGERDDRP
jgi:hypothetical protein